MATKNPQYLKEWQFPAEFEQLISSWNAQTQIEILGYVTKANKNNLNRNVEYSKTQKNSSSFTWTAAENYVYKPQHNIFEDE